MTENKEPMDLKRFYKRLVITVVLVALFLAVLIGVGLFTANFYGQVLEDSVTQSLNDRLQGVALRINGQVCTMRVTALDREFGLLDCLFPHLLYLNAETGVYDQSGACLAQYAWPVVMEWSQSYTKQVNVEAGYGGADWLMDCFERMVLTLQDGSRDPVTKYYDLGDVAFREDCSVSQAGTIEYRCQSGDFACEGTLAVYPNRVEITLDYS